MNTDAIIVENITKTFKIGKPRGISTFVKNLSKNQKSLRALDGISFTVKKGESLGIIGLNASGKSTLLRIVSGILRPDSGVVKINGKMSPLMQLGTGFQADLNTIDNIILNGVLLGIPKSEMEDKVESIIEWAELTRFSNMKLKNFSTGMRSRLAFSISLQIKSDILLLDEVLSVGDRLFREKSYEAFLSFRKNKKTILQVTHNLGNLPKYTDRVLLLHQGKIISIGKPEEVITRYKEISSM